MMKPLVTSVFALALLATVPAATINFDSDTPGQPPAGWTVAKTGTGSPRWTIEADATAPTPPHVLKQSGQATYPLCLKDDIQLQNGFVEVKFKALAGKEDQAAGLIWRCQDPDNYYLARANALEDNVTIYHTLHGKRVAFKNVNLKVSPLAWHTLRVEFQRNHFTVLFDGAKVIEATDETFTGPGRVGLWTKADSVTLFDDFACDEK